MASVIIAGDGPAGLSAALLLSKNDSQVTVFGRDQTAVHYAQLRNYLGVDDEPGPSFQARARAQVARFGARLVEADVVDVSRDEDGFRVRTDEGGDAQAEYLVIAAGKKGARLVEQLGIASSSAGVEVDAEYRTSVERVYAVGRLARPARSQAIISAGAGAVVALDILSREAGTHVTDWDTPD